MARGPGIGISNNPAGKPSGTANKLSASIKSRIVERLQKDFDKYFEELNALEGKDYVRCITELLKLVVPRPLNDEETNNINANSELIKRLFNK
jgi:hypothetical protein